MSPSLARDYGRARRARQSILRNDTPALHQKDDTFEEQSDIPAAEQCDLCV
jgi:hypothetical protein